MCGLKWLQQTADPDGFLLTEFNFQSLLEVKIIHLEPS